MVPPPDLKDRFTLARWVKSSLIQFGFEARTLVVAKRALPPANQRARPNPPRQQYRRRPTEERVAEEANEFILNEERRLAEKRRKLGLNPLLDPEEAYANERYELRSQRRL